MILWTTEAEFREDINYDQLMAFPNPLFQGFEFPHGSGLPYVPGSAVPGWMLMNENQRSSIEKALSNTGRLLSKPQRHVRCITPLNGPPDPEIIRILFVSRLDYVRAVKTSIELKLKMLQEVFYLHIGTNFSIQEYQTGVEALARDKVIADNEEGWLLCGLYQLACKLSCSLNGLLSMN